MSKNVLCNNCSKIIAQGHVITGKISIDCRYCGVRNVIGPDQKTEPAARVINLPGRNYTAVR